MIIAADKEVGELKRGLHFKLVLIMLLLIASLMTVVGVFLVRGVKQYYLNQFYSQMSSAFSDPDFADALTTAASEEKGETLIDEILLAYAGSLGINSSSRYYYVLDKNTAGVLAPSTAIDTKLEITPNMITAMTGEPGDNGDIGAAYMDVAMPIGDKEHSYIIYIKDNKHTVQELNNELFQIILKALLVGLVISVLLSFLLSKTMVIPIQSLTRAANRVAAGDFTEKIEVTAKDEIGILTRTFNDMANKLHSTLQDIENEKNKLSTVFSNMTDGIIAFSKNGDIIHYNPVAEHMLNISLSGSLSAYDDIFGHMIPAEKVNALAAPESLKVEGDFGEKNLEISLVPFSGESAQGGILAVIHDITLQKRSDEMRREFVANVSHELKTPITSIRSYAETLVTSGAEVTEDTRQSFLDVIVNESDRMNKIVQDLLALSKFDAGEASMHFEPFDIIKSIKNIYNTMILDVKKNRLNMSLNLEETVPPIEGDKSRIEQVLINIISNAVRYTPEGGEIIISTAYKNKRIRICVKDTGIGIPKEDIPRLFDRFYRVDKARSRAFGGTGLGLSIAHEIVSKHGGEIEVESALQKGTTVTVILPIKQPGN